jgi:hypothetical protein
MKSRSLLNKRGIISNADCMILLAFFPAIKKAATGHQG